IEQRVYLGTWTNDAELQYTIALFLQKKEALLESVRRFRKLTGLQRFEVSEYLEEFFVEMEEIKLTGYQDVYLQLRGENISALPDGGRAVDYSISKR
ncbi:MAG: hypothetical protein AAGJ93_15995, partial [Bacteroidota bacterium]